MWKHQDLKIPMLLILVLALLIAPKFIFSMLLISGFILFAPVLLVIGIFLFIFFRNSKRVKAHHKNQHRAEQSAHTHRAEQNNTTKKGKSHTTITLSENDYQVVDKKTSKD